MGKSVSGKSAKGRQHANHAKKYLRQWPRVAKHKAKAWTAHLSRHPNDKQAIKDIGVAREKIRKF